MENEVANPLYNLWGLVWNNYSEDAEYVFRFPYYPFTIFPNYIYLFQYDNEYSSLGLVE